MSMTLKLGDGMVGVVKLTKELQAAEELKFLRLRVIECAAGMKSSIKSAFVYRYAAGMALKQAATVLPHGSLESWKKASFPDVARSALANWVHYADTLNEKLALADGILPAEGKYPSDGHLDFAHSLAVKLLDNTASEEERTRFAVVVHEVTMGKTMTEMAREQAVTREAKKPAHHPAKPLSTAEKIAAERAEADAAADYLGARIGILIEEGCLSIERMSDEKRVWLEGLRIELGHKIKPFILQKGTKRTKGRKKLSGSRAKAVHG